MWHAGGPIKQKSASTDPSIFCITQFYLVLNYWPGVSIYFPTRTLLLIGYIISRRLQFCPTIQCLIVGVSCLIQNLQHFCIKTTPVKLVLESSNLFPEWWGNEYYSISSNKQIGNCSFLSLENGKHRVSSVEYTTSSTQNLHLFRLPHTLHAQDSCAESKTLIRYDQISTFTISS